MSEEKITIEDAGLNEQLVLRLRVAWNEIADQHEDDTGNRPNLVIPLEVMVEKKTLSKSDFSRSITGAGVRKGEYTEAMANLAERLIADWTLKSESSTDSGSSLDESGEENRNDDSDKEFVEITRKLSFNLVNLTKNNKLLSMLDIGKSYIDASFLGLHNVESLDFDIVACDRSKPEFIPERYNKLMEIDLTAKSLKRDKGQNSLYLALFFCEGKLRDSNMGTKCPLIQIPVKLERESTRLHIKSDPSRDTIFNNDFVLYNLYITKANERLQNTTVKEQLELMGLEECNTDNLTKAISKYYGQYGITINQPTYTEADSFTPSDSTNLDSVDFRDYTVYPYMVLGSFQNSDSNLKRDFDLIVESDKIPTQIKELIKNSAMQKTGSFYDDGQIEVDSDVSEGDIEYINYLNGSQEEILSAIQKIPYITIQGPPGTGKSQVIADLAVKETNEGKTVLIVSEKETALLVLKNRLGSLGSTALCITDATDKDTFYRSIEEQLNFKGKHKRTDLSEINRKIDNDVARLRKIQEIMFQPMPGFGVEPYKLYSMGRQFDLTNPDDLNRFNYVLSKTSEHVLGMTYQTLTSVHKEMCQPATSKVMFDALSLATNYPWLTMIRDNLTEVDVANMVADLKALLAAKDEGTDKKPGLGKIFGKPKDVGDRKAFANKYLKSYKDMDTLLECTDLEYMVSTYMRYRDASAAYGSREEDLKQYAKVLYEVAEGKSKLMEVANDDVYKVVIHKRLSDFSKQQEEAIGAISGFDSIIETIEQRTLEKMDAVRINTADALATAIGNIEPFRQDIEMELDKRERLPISRFCSKYPILQSFRILLMTPGTVSDLMPLIPNMFNLLIFDEASQIYLERSIPSIYRAERVVIAGDSKQLRPSNIMTCRIGNIDPDDADDDRDVALEQESLLDLARFRYKTYMLDTHYRSRYEELIAFSNNAFYKGKMNICPNTVRPTVAPIQYHLVDGIWDNQINRAEADYIVKWLKGFLKNRQNNESIGIITFNSKQRDHILSVLQAEEDKDSEFSTLMAQEWNRKTSTGENDSLFVNNIENVQGDERDVIVFSIGYAPDKTGVMMQRFGWLNQAGGGNRLNVAITRAKKAVHVVASVEPTKFRVENTKNDGPKLLKEYLIYAKAVSDHDENKIKEVLSRVPGSSIITKDHYADKALDELHEYLTAKGYKVKRDVGISGYSLDLAVYDSKGYILGIEADANLYPAIESTRARDIHHLRFLRDRGWVIQRFWMVNYWKDSQQEFSRIEKQIRLALDASN